MRKGTPLLNHKVGLQFIIHDGSAFGPNLYFEFDTVTTSAIGNFSIVVGNQLPQIWAAIDWGNGNKYLEVDMDATGGNNYTYSNTTQLVSVPYALYANKAKTADNVVNGAHHMIGESFGGGRIFNLYKDSLGEEHGLIYAPDVLVGCRWGGPNVDSFFMHALDHWNGKANTDTVYIGHFVTTNSAIGYAHLYNGGGYNDWYLPSIFELKLLFYAGPFTILSLNSISGYGIYWSSTEYDAQDEFALAYNPTLDAIGPYTKFTQNIYSAIPIRRF